MRVVKTIFPYLLSFSIFAYILGICYLLWNQPYLGFSWRYSSGAVYQIDPALLNIEEIQMGDRVIAGNGVHSTDIYKSIRQTDINQITIFLERGDRRFSILTEIREPSLWIRVGRLIDPLVAIVFLSFGSFVYAFSKVNKKSIYFLLFSLFGAFALASSSAAFLGTRLATLLMHSGVIWCAFAMVPLHLEFPDRIEIPNRKWLIFSLLVVNGLLTGINTILFAFNYQSTAIEIISLIVAAIELSGVGLLLYVSSRKARSSVVKNRASRILLALLFGLTPSVLLSFLPAFLSGSVLAFIGYSSLSLLFIPTGYGYTIIQYRWGGINKALNRGAALGLVILLIGGLYGVFVSAMVRFFPGIFDSYPTVEVLIILAIAGLSHRLYSLILSWVNRVFHGEWYDYRSAVNLVSQKLKGDQTDDAAIAAAFCQVVGKALLLEFAGVVMPDQQLVLSVFPHSSAAVQKLLIPDQAAILKDLFQKPADQAVDHVQNHAVMQKILPGQLWQKIQMVIPLEADGNTIGVLILGNKRDSGPFENSDMEILELAIAQARISLEKAVLLEEVKAYSEENSRLHRLAREASDIERKKLSHDLHDEIIQPLVGLNYTIAEMRNRSTGTDVTELRNRYEEVQAVLNRLREICVNLRPPVLDNVGLVSAFRSRINEMERRTALSINLLVDGDEDRIISDRVGMFAYRMLQEGLVNIHKHAQAQCVEVRLSVSEDRLLLEIVDDGKGFTVPDRLSVLEGQYHIGLASLEENCRLLQGQFTVRSDPGEGSSITAILPLEKNTDRGAYEYSNSNCR
jgi:signal transduction histidine kinase